MIYKILITLKDCGKTIEILVEKIGDNKVFEISETMGRVEWLVIKGFEAHPLKVDKEIAVRWEEIAGIEILQVNEQWFVDSAKDFTETLDENKFR